MNKYLTGSVEAAGAEGVVPLNHLRPRPSRESAAGVEQTDGPYEYVNIQGFKRMSAQVTVDGGAAEFTLEVTNGDPSDVDTPWFVLQTASGLDGALAPDSDMLIAIDLAYRFARVAWNTGTGAPDIGVHFVAEC